MTIIYKTYLWYDLWIFIYVIYVKIILTFDLTYLFFSINLNINSKAIRERDLHGPYQQEGIPSSDPRPPLRSFDHEAMKAYHWCWIFKTYFTGTNYASYFYPILPDKISENDFIIFASFHPKLWMDQDIILA